MDKQQPVVTPFEPYAADPNIAEHDNGGRPPGVSARRANAALIATAFAASLLVTNEIAPIGLVTLIADDLGRTEGEVGWLAAAFAAGVAVAAVPLAIVTTRLPRRPLLVATVVTFGAGVAIEAAASNFGVLIAGRMVTAAAHALFWAVAAPAVAGMFPATRRGNAVTRLLIGASMAGLVGLPAATWLAQRTVWNTPFWALAGGAVLAAVAVAAAMPTYQPEQGSASRGELPSGKRFGRILAVCGLTTTAMSLTWYFITPFLQEVSRFAEETIPTLLLILGIIGLVGMFVASIFIDRAPVRFIAGALGLLTLLWVAYSAFGDFKAVAVAGFMAQGIGFSFFVAGMAWWAMRHSPWRSDIGFAVYVSVFSIGNMIGPIVGGDLLDTHGAEWLPVASLVVSAAALVLVLTVPHLSPTERAHARARLTRG